MYILWNKERKGEVLTRLSTVCIMVTSFLKVIKYFNDSIANNILTSGTKWSSWGHDISKGGKNVTGKVGGGTIFKLLAVF